MVSQRGKFAFICHSSSTQILIRKCHIWSSYVASLSHLRCHIGLPSHIKLCPVIKCRHHNIN